ncbi:MAG: DnaJ domain-containing protein [Nitrospinae bacterium]|jgi:DnaJ-domain-containing protein 1|nr:DnaJ domain-containing protein [Nitrospinota bacterium]MDA1108828.1 DnaJ domain-containing protein [Nitrospinota bacterium]
MMKRLVDIARANLNDFMGKRTEEKTVYNPNETPFNFDTREAFESAPVTSDPFIQYYANLEIQPGSNRTAVKSAWKRLLKKYHPDLHDADPEKRKVAGELTLRLTESYRLLDKELSKRG